MRFIYGIIYIDLIIKIKGIDWTLYLLLYEE